MKHPVQEPAFFRSRLYLGVKIFLGLTLAFLAATLAIDTGSLLQYALTIFGLCLALNGGYKLLTYGRQAS